MQIEKGQRIALSALAITDGRLNAAVLAQVPGASVDLACFGLDAAGVLADERYLTFFNQPATPCGAVTLLPDGFAFDLDRLPASIDRLVLTAAIDGAGTFAQLEAGHVRLLRDGVQAAQFDVTSAGLDEHRALMLAELYRKDGVWRFAALGQAIAGGMDALVAHFGAAVEPDQATPPASVPHAALHIAISADSTTGYAAIQNSIPVLRAITLTNRGEQALSNVDVQVHCTPAFALATRLTFDHLAAGETRQIAPIDLAPDHAYLSSLNEALRAHIHVKASTSAESLGEARQPIEVLAYDQWAGTRALPELLAAFCMPNSPVVDQLLGAASTLLRASALDAGMNGYQARHREKVWQQVSALYSTVVAEDLQYANPPASFGNDGQKIRTPERIIEGRIATCLDLAMLFASLLEQTGLHPVVLFKNGHAWVGVWLIDTCFSTALVDDVQAVRKRVKSGEFIVFETTGVTDATRPSLRWACTTGEQHLDDEAAFLNAVDIRRARELLIRPLPSRATPTDTAPLAPPDSPPAIEAMPPLPPLDPAFLPQVEGRLPDTPEGRLARWKSKLLDLTLRNRLLNFKQVKTSLRLICPDPAALEDVLSEGKEFSIRALPAVMTGAATRDMRDAAVHTARTGSAPLDALASDGLGRREIIVDVADDALDARLLEIFRAAGTGLEEGGANTLFLAFGLLQWQEDKEAEATHLAPILLIPVTLTRQSVRSGYRLTRHDDDALVNPTLVQKLLQDFGLKLPPLDVLLTDDKGIDVAKVLQIFRLHVGDMAGWEVKDQVHLGIFSFTKFLMWRDLHDRQQQLMENSVVAHLINHPGEAFGAGDIGFPADTLDQSHRPQDLFAPLLSDSSQLRAICAVSDGRNLVVEGPPGTGKSQTITNMIAHLLATGKTVLFVSEKMAALEVVHRRLNSMGLGAFCLELHSAKAKKSTVLKQLGIALDTVASRSVADWDLEADRLAALRAELNAMAQALHRYYPHGLTVYDAIGTCIAHQGQRPATLDWQDPLIHGRAELEGLRDTSRQMAALAGQLSELQQHPLAAIGQTDWSHAWQQDLLTGADALTQAAQALQTAAAGAFDLFGLAPQGHSLDQLMLADRLADVVLRAPTVPAGVARAAHDEEARAKLAVLRQRGMLRASIWTPLGQTYRDELASLNAGDLKLQWAQARTTWWPRSWLAMRAVSTQLAAYARDLRRPPDAQIDPLLDTLGKLNAEDLALAALAPDAAVLLQDSFAAHQTDWAAVQVAEQWALEFSGAVNRLAGTDMELAARLRATLQRYVADNRAALAQTGPAGAVLVTYRDAVRTFAAALQQLEALAYTPALVPEPAAGGALTRLLGQLQGWHGAARQLQPWCLWRRVRAKAVAQGLQGVLRALDQGEVPLSAIPDFFEYSYQSWWVRKIIDREPALRDFSSADHERKIVEFQHADARFQQLTQQFIVARLSGQIPVAEALIGADSEMGKLRRELQKQRKHMPIRQLVQSLPTLMPKLKPCLLMSPLSVAQYLDAGHAQFDVVIFDEASQIPVWDAVGAIARGRQLACVGDPKQLPPTSFFNRVDDPDASSEEDEVQDLESILDECLGIGMPRLSLNWHYRSRHESLITFSNVTYYDSQLITFPSPVTQDAAVRFEHVSGVYDRGGARNNRAEAHHHRRQLLDHRQRHRAALSGPGQTPAVAGRGDLQSGPANADRKPARCAPARVGSARPGHCPGQRGAAVHQEPGERAGR